VRHDIQFLRGIAVLSVLLYHANISPVANGYLGVDIFFVVSGFLITKIILTGLSRDSFSFTQFYLRRAKRLLPALYSTLFFTTLLAYAFLTNRQWADYVDQFLGAITFTSNMVLPFQVGYFEDAADTRPLLHIWSLSLEEQYYFLLPLCLSLVAGKFRFAVLLSGFFISFALCQFMINTPFSYWRMGGNDSAAWAFFLFPTRAWELFAGSLTAWFMLRNPEFTLPVAVKLATLPILLFLLCVPIDPIHPRGDAFIAVTITALLIAGQDNWLRKNVYSNTIAKVGDWSYSLYLIHWPLLAFSQIAFLGNPPITAAIGIGIVSIFLAWLQYKFVEQRYRMGWGKGSAVDVRRLLGVTALLLLTLLPAKVIDMTGDSTTADDSAVVRMRNYGLSPQCAQGDQFEISKSCITSDSPRIAVWGDSFAMHLVPGIAIQESAANSLVQITKSACGPIIGIAPIQGLYNENWAAKCLLFNEQALDYIMTSQSIEYVVISSSFGHYFKDSGQKWLYEGKTVPPDSHIAIEHLVKTLGKISSAGKTPILISPPPTAGFNIGDCWERKIAGRITLGRQECNLTRDEYELFESETISALKQVEKRANVKVVWLADYLCSNSMCETKLNDIYLYRDGGHLSITGSEYLIPRLQLIPQLK
jgi:peptidoglycan/LPS O-acetylase OafA/YrhL